MSLVGARPTMSGAPSRRSNDVHAVGGLISLNGIAAKYDSAYGAATSTGRICPIAVSIARALFWCSRNSRSGTES